MQSTPAQCVNMLEPLIKSTGHGCRHGCTACYYNAHVCKDHGYKLERCRDCQVDRALGRSRDDNRHVYVKLFSDLAKYGIRGTM